MLPVLAVGALRLPADGARHELARARRRSRRGSRRARRPRTRLVASAGAVILCGAATAVAGPIAFVGLVIPHLCRLLVGTDHRWLLPFSTVAGAALLVAAESSAASIARPDEIEVGIITAFIGAPFFIWIVRRQKVREL